MAVVSGVIAVPGFIEIATDGVLILDPQEDIRLAAQPAIPIECVEIDVEEEVELEGCVAGDIHIRILNYPRAIPIVCVGGIETDDVLEDR